MNNRVAEQLNVDGRRGEKLAFITMDLYNIVIGKIPTIISVLKLDSIIYNLTQLNNSHSILFFFF